LLRQEGPACNSHARKGVVAIVLIDLEARRAVTYAMRCHQSLLCAAPSALICLERLLIHALTGVAITCRPFGPAMLGNRGKEFRDRLLLSQPTILVQKFV